MGINLETLKIESQLYDKELCIFDEIIKENENTEKLEVIKEKLEEKYGFSL